MQLRHLFRHWAESLFAPGQKLRRRYEAFKRLLDRDKRCLERITELEEILHGQVAVDWARVASLVAALRWSARELADSLLEMNPLAHRGLGERLDELDAALAQRLAEPSPEAGPPYVLSLDEAADRPGECGGKAANLGRAARIEGVRTPEGFAVRASAFHAFLAENDLRPRLDELLSRVEPENPEQLDELSAHMQELLEDGAMPGGVAAEAAGAVKEASGGEGWLWAVRSSAVGEDEAGLTFAGLYDSKLNVPSEGVADALREVFLSKYGSRAVAYRIRAGLPDQDAPMAALVVRMARPRAAGVVYTADGPPGGEKLFIYAVPGLADDLVGGEERGAEYALSRDETPELLKAPEDGPLTSDEAVELARVALRVERAMGGPQDIEWCWDEESGPLVVQARPFAAEAVDEECPTGLPGCEQVDAQVLLRGGERASGGVAMGTVHFPRGHTEARDIPVDAVVVCRTLSPRLVSSMGRMAAVVSPAGSRAGHFASVAREYGVPVIVGAPDPFGTLPEGEVVTVDADTGAVYHGAVEELRARMGRRTLPETPLRQRMQSFMDLVSPLSLTDPTAAAFKPGGIQSFHDLVRYCHEMGVREMFDLVGLGGRGMSGAKRMDTDLPLEFRVLDLEDGVDWERATGMVPPEAITSRPMRAVWDGLTHPEFSWEGAMAHLDEAVFDERMATTAGLVDATMASYAIVSRPYAHLMIRFGYHFAMVDAYISNDPEANYAGFRFKGGGASFEQRLLRLEFLRLVLEAAGFETRIRGDLMDAQVRRGSREDTEEALRLLGVILARTRVMDMSMKDLGQARELAEEFAETYMGRSITAAE